MTGNSAMTLSQIRLLVDDFPTVFRFYRGVVGLPVVSGDENEVYAAFETGAAEVALFRRDLMEQAVGASIGPVSGLARAAVVLQVADVDEVWERMRAAGAEELAGPTDRPDWGIRTAQFRDPEGNIVEVFTALAH